MSAEGEVTHAFDCPECGEDLEVNEPMKAALIERGCVICGATVSSDAFTHTSDQDSA